MLKQKWKTVKFWFKRNYHLLFNKDLTVRLKFPYGETPFMLGEVVLMEEVIYRHLGDNIFLIVDFAKTN